LIAEVQKAQERFSDLQRRLQEEVETLGVLLKREQVEEQAALAQFDKVLNQEREIKRAHLALVLEIKSKMTHEQQAKLRDKFARPKKSSAFFKGNCKKSRKVCNAGRMRVRPRPQSQKPCRNSNRG
jgi:Spy/CpxP family protein refolding chaperone